MSALDVLIHDLDIEHHNVEFVYACESELAQLRAQDAMFSKLAVILNAVDAADVIGAVDSLYTQLRAQAAELQAARDEAGAIDGVPLAELIHEQRETHDFCIEERDGLRATVTELRALVRMEHVKPPFDVNDDATTELAIECARLEKRNAERERQLSEALARIMELEAIVNNQNAVLLNVAEQDRQLQIAYRLIDAAKNSSSNNRDGWFYQACISWLAANAPQAEQERPS